MPIFSIRRHANFAINLGRGEFIIFNILLAQLLLGMSGSAFSAKANWLLLGREPLGVGSVYLDVNSVKVVDGGSLFAAHLVDLDDAQAGVDLPDPTSRSGLRYDTRYPHSSYISLDLYDCRRGRTANLQSRYFSGKMASGARIYTYRDESPIWVGALPGLDNLVLRSLCKK